MICFLRLITPGRTTVSPVTVAPNDFSATDSTKSLGTSNVASSFRMSTTNSKTWSAPSSAEDGADQVLLFVVDILNEEATLLVPNDLVESVAEKSFGATVTGDTVVLPGVMSRKKQIIPVLTV